LNVFVSIETDQHENLSLMSLSSFAMGSTFPHSRVGVGFVW
jgi:hypothetical protein